MKWALLSLAVAWLGCSLHRRVAPERGDYPDNPGGDCFWSIKEAGAECVVEIGGTTRSRRPGDAELYITEGYGKQKWPCGQKREVCGSMAECTCLSSAGDGGVELAGTVNSEIQEVVFAALREKALETLQRKRDAVLCASVGPGAFYREPDEVVLHRLNAGREDKLLSQFTCNPMPLKSTDGSLNVVDQRRVQEGQVRVQGIVTFGQGVGSIGEFVLTKRDGMWTIANVSWRPYGTQAN